MTCDRVLLLLSDFIDGELSSAGVLGIQTHLKRCASCEEEHQALRRTVQLVALYGRQEAPVDCRAAVMARLREEPTPAPRLTWRSLLESFPLRAPAAPAWSRATALAGLVVVCVGASTLMMDRPQEGPPAGPAVQLAQDESARVRESSQLLQALGRDDGYILAADLVDWNR